MLVCGDVESENREDGLLRAKRLAATGPGRFIVGAELGSRSGAEKGELNILYTRQPKGHNLKFRSEKGILREIRLPASI
jgi:hypothetical protein